mgnify:FL=1
MQEYLIPVPLGSYAKTAEDTEIINAVSQFEARKEFFRWTINDASIAYYECMVSEWSRRYGNKHIPRIIFKKSDFQEYEEEYEFIDDEEVYDELG